MKAKKVICTIKTETLSSDSIPALLLEVAAVMRNESPEGTLIKDDGDMIEWSTMTKKITF